MATEHAKTNTSYIFRRRTSSTIYLKNIQKCRRNNTAGVMVFDCHLEIIES
jgi:hypothetical protein